MDLRDMSLSPALRPATKATMVLLDCLRVPLPSWGRGRKLRGPMWPQWAPMGRGPMGPKGVPTEGRQSSAHPGHKVCFVFKEPTSAWECRRLCFHTGRHRQHSDRSSFHQQHQESKHPTNQPPHCRKRASRCSSCDQCLSTCRTRPRRGDERPRERQS